MTMNTYRYSNKLTKLWKAEKMFDNQKAAEEQISREVREETLLLIKEAGQLLEKIEEFKAAQNAASTVIKETLKNNRDMQNYFKMIVYFLFKDKPTMDFIEEQAAQVNDREFLKWFKLTRKLRGDD